MDYKFVVISALFSCLFLTACDDASNECDEGAEEACVLESRLDSIYDKNKGASVSENLSVSLQGALSVGDLDCENLDTEKLYAFKTFEADKSQTLNGLEGAQSISVIFDLESVDFESGRGYCVLGGSAGISYSMVRDGSVLFGQPMNEDDNPVDGARFSYWRQYRHSNRNNLNATYPYIPSIVQTLGSNTFISNDCDPSAIKNGFAPFKGEIIVSCDVNGGPINGGGVSRILLPSGELTSFFGVRAMRINPNEEQSLYRKRDRFSIYEGSSGIPSSFVQALSAPIDSSFKPEFFLADINGRTDEELTIFDYYYSDDDKIVMIVGASDDSPNFITNLNPNPRYSYENREKWVFDRNTLQFRLAGIIPSQIEVPSLETDASVDLISFSPDSAYSLDRDGRVYQITNSGVYRFNVDEDGNLNGDFDQVYISKSIRWPLIGSGLYSTNPSLFFKFKGYNE